MKKLIATFADDADIDVSALLASCIDIEIKTIQDSPVMHAPRRHHRTEVTVEQIVMSHYSPNARFTAESANTWATKLGYAPTSATSVLSTLSKRGFIRCVGQNGRAKVWEFAKPFPASEMPPKGVIANLQNGNGNGDLKRVVGS